MVRYRCPPEYYICNVSQRPTRQKSTSKRGGRVKYLPSSTMVYSCTCARLQNPGTPSLVCVPRPGFAAPVRIPQIAAYQHGAI